jgi:hypothetical protein
MLRLAVIVVMVARLRLVRRAMMVMMFATMLVRILVSDTHDTV